LPVRVLHVDTATEWRGGQVQLLHLVRGMLGHGCDVTVGCPPDSPLWKAVGQTAASRMALPAGRSIRAAIRVARADVDLVAAHTSHAHTVCLGVGRPLVVHRRVDFPPSGGWKYRKPDVFVAVSHAVAQVLQDMGADRVSVVHSGVTEPPSVAPAADGPVVLAVGARVPHKGHAVLAHAAAELGDVDIGVVGDGPLTPPGLRWLGWRDDVPALLRKAAVFVQPSLQEGLGTAAIEAMMAGVPVVATDVGGLPEVVGDAGVLVAPGDATALAAGIRRALSGDHPSTADAREWALSRFGVDRMVDETMAIYRAVLRP
jgi:glycosyltransferase involved in cell wall biosynthesis